MVSYNRDSPGSMLTSQYRLPNRSRESIVKEDVLPVAIGLKVGVTLGHGRKKESYTTFDPPPVFNRK